MGNLILIDIEFNKVKLIRNQKVGCSIHLSGTVFKMVLWILFK